VAKFKLHIQKGHRSHHDSVDKETTDLKKDIIVDITIIVSDELGLAFDAAELIVLLVVVINRVLDCS
jgi:hypothetical protein